MKHAGTAEWFHNRPRQRRDVLRRWLPRWRSGAVHALERVLGGGDAWSWLATDFSTLSHLNEVGDSLVSVVQIEEARMLPAHALPQDVWVPYPSRTRNPVMRTLLANVHCHVPTGMIRLPSGHVFMGSDGVTRFGLIPGGPTQELHDLTRDAPSISGTTAVAAASQYYYHHLVDNCIPLLKAKTAEPDLVVLTPPGQSRWYYDLLTLLGLRWRITPHLVVQLERVVCVDRAPATPEDVALLRAALPFIAPRDSEVLLVSRRGLPRFDTQSETRMLELLGDFQVSVVDPGNLPVADQVSTFSGASVVIGDHGGALANCVWATPGTLIVENFPHAFRGREYAHLAWAAGLVYLPILPSEIAGLSEVIRKQLVCDPPYSTEQWNIK